MNGFLIALLVLAVIATLVALVRGIVVFLKTTEEDLKSGATGPSLSSQRQNKMMFARVGFQALAVAIVVIILLVGRSR